MTRGAVDRVSDRRLPLIFYGVVRAVHLPASLGVQALRQLRRGVAGSRGGRGALVEGRPRSVAHLSGGDRGSLKAVGGTTLAWGEQFVASFQEVTISAMPVARSQKDQAM
jgi:hypothetical protein